MRIAAVIPESWEASLPLEWSLRIARAFNGELLLFKTRQRSGETSIEDVATPEPVVDSPAEPGATSDDSASATTLRITGPDPVGAVLREITARGVTLLVVPRHPSETSDSSLFQEQQRLLRGATCQTLEIRLGGGSCRDIVVAAGGGV